MREAVSGPARTLRLTFISLCAHTHGTFREPCREPPVCIPGLVTTGTLGESLAPTGSPPIQASSAALQPGPLSPGPSPIPSSPPPPPPGLTSDAQGEVLAAAGLAKGIMGTAGVDTAVLRAGWPEGQVSLLAADRVVALTIREGAPISVPLVAGSAGAQEDQQQGGGGGSVLRWPVGRVQNRRVRARPLSLHMGKLRPGEGP